MSNPPSPTPQVTPELVLEHTLGVSAAKASRLATYAADRFDGQSPHLAAEHAEANSEYHRRNCERWFESFCASIRVAYVPYRDSFERDLGTSRWSRWPARTANGS